MSQLGTGWEIICPDGRVRRWPYVSRDAAEADARVFSDCACRGQARPSVMEAGQPPCPGGRHAVRPTALLARAAAKAVA